MPEERITAEQVADAAAEHADAVRRNSKMRGQLQTHLYALALRWRIQKRDEEQTA